MKKTRITCVIVEATAHIGIAPGSDSPAIIQLTLDAGDAADLAAAIREAVRSAALAARMLAAAKRARGKNVS